MWLGGRQRARPVSCAAAQACLTLGLTVSDTRPSRPARDPALVVGQRFEVGALVATWLERHPRWLARVASAVELDAASLSQLIVLVLTARQFLSREDFVHLAAGDGWIRLEPGASDASAVARLLDPWWTALDGAPEYWAAPSLMPREQGAVWLRAWVQLIGKVHLFVPEDLDLARVVAPMSWQLSGLSLMGEGLAIGRVRVEGPGGLATAWSTMRERVLGPLERHGMLPHRPSRERAAGELFPYIRTPTSLQALASELKLAPGPQLILIEEASGGGKTEAAIILAHRLVTMGRGESITFALPWAAAPKVVQQRALDVQSLLFEADGRASLSPNRWNRRDLLADDQSTLGGDADPGRVLLDGFLGDPRKRALWAPIGGDTLDQVLLAALPARFSGLRLLALSRSVLVIDQLQASDENAIRWLASLLELHAAVGGSAIISTSALSRDTRARLTAPFLRAAGPVQMVDRGQYPRVTHASAHGLSEKAVEHADPSKHGLRIHIVDQESAALNRVVEAQRAGLAACWVRNSVEAAIVAYAHAVRTAGPERVILVHERFTIGDRLDIERACTARFGRGSSADARAGWLVIATSSIEPRDLDFDVMVSDLAPIEVLLDRAGRVHRHRRTIDGAPTDGEDGRGERVLTVVSPPWTETPSPSWVAERLPESAGAYAEHGTLWLTLRTLRGLNDPIFPEDVPRLLESVYGEDAMEAIPHALWQSKARLGVEPQNELEALRQVPLLPTPSRIPANVVREGWTTPSRLGPEYSILRLARVVGGVVMPLYGSPTGGWELSELSVPSAWIARRVTGGLEAEISTAEALMADHGRYCVTVVLTWDALHEQWWGVSVGSQGQPVELVYRADVGLVGRS